MHPHRSVVEVAVEEAVEEEEVEAVVVEVAVEVVEEAVVEEEDHLVVNLLLRFSPRLVPRSLCLPFMTCYILKVPVLVTCDREYLLHKMDCLSRRSGSLYPT